MGERHIGLDIGSFAVRAAEVSRDAGVPVLHRFAQITLPPRSVVEGEIVDRAAVTATIKELWAKGGFKAKKVVLGVSNRDVKVRQAEVPALAPEEVRSALRYDNQDMMPFADEAPVVDFLVQDRFVRDGSEMLRVLVVTAPHAKIDEAVAAASDAGLVVEAVDLTPFALVRALGSASDPGSGEVIVSVGAGLTSVVVHSGGIPQLVRTTPGGGGAITEGLAASLSVAYEEAEALKRTGATHTSDGGRVAAVIETQLDTLVPEIAGSLDYFVAQTAETEVRRVVLTGAGSLVPGLRERIASASNLQVLPADALTNVALGKTRLTPEQLVAASTTLAGPIGLALAPLADPSTRLTALLPAHHAQRYQVKREAKVVVSIVCLLAVALASLWGKRTLDVRSAKSGVTHELHLAASVEARNAAYARLAVAEAALSGKSALVSGALNNDADPSALLDRIAGAIPTDVWLQSISLSLASAKGTGTVTFSLQGTNGDAPAHWISAMRGLTSTFDSLWVSGVSITTVGGQQTLSFTSTASLNPGVLSQRADAYRVPK
jgi:type IV pilus assembly protein PilM